jgi:hypothetical protein
MAPDAVLSRVSKDEWLDYQNMLKELKCGLWRFGCQTGC